MSGGSNRCTKSDIEEWLKQIILEKENFKDCTVEICGNSEVGDGYIGEITFVTVSGKTEKNEVYNFVIKCGKKSKQLREALPVRASFLNEIFFYEKIVPEFIKFQKEKKVKNPFVNVAKCYGTLILKEMEVLVLENLKSTGYQLHNRKQPMNKEHIRAVMKLYGKLHAVSYALRDQSPSLLQEFSDNLVDVFKQQSNVFKFPDDFNIHQFIIDLAKEENDNAVIEKAISLNEKQKKEFKDIADPTDPYAVIIHGDCWNNNFMFKYEGDNYSSPSDVRFLDFQLSKLTSPVIDLSYFLFTCLSEEDVPNFDEINNLYYESLSNSLQQMGSDVKKMLPFEELMNQWKKYSLFGLTMMPRLIQACLSEEDEVIDLEKSAEDEDSREGLYETSVRNKDKYRRRTLPIMRLAIERGLAE